MAKKLPYNTDTLLAETQAMLDQTKAEGLKPFKGSSFESDFKKGIVTSDDARARAKNADKTITDITPIDEGGAESPVSALYKRLNSLQSELKKAKEAEKKAKDDQANADIQAKLKNIDSASEVGESAKTDISAGVDAILNDGKTDNIEDPVIRSLAEKTSANISIISNQMNTLENYRKQFNQYTKDDIDSIARTAERSIQRQTEENERTANAMRFAGVISGRAQFSPLIEQSIIKDVIQEGLDEIEVINEKKNSAIREARRAEAEFNVDAFEQQAELAKEYNSQIESAISNMNQRVREAEQDERARVEFRQAQEERNSLILAEELIDATPEQIAQAAAANGIDIGLLSKAVNDAKFEKQSQELDIAGKKENILASQDSRRLGWANYALNKAKFDAEQVGDKVEPMTVAEIKEFTERNGWRPPQGMTLATAQAIHGGLRVLPEDVREEYSTLMVTDPGAADKYLSEQLNKVASTSIEDKLNVEGNEEVKKLYEKAASEMGVAKLFTFGDFKNVAETDEFKQAYTDVFTERMTAAADPSSGIETFATDAEFLKAVLDKTLELNTGKNKKLQELKSAVNTSSGTAKSTPAVNF